MNKKILLSTFGAVSSLFLFTTSVSAHAIVRPSQVGVAEFQDFSLGVPSEKNASTTSVKLLLPAGLNFVTPMVKPGWKIEVKSGPLPSGIKAPVAADGDVAKTIPTEIDWTGGTIPTGQKDIFAFSAQAPAVQTELNWKVYQGYSDGSTVSWDQSPSSAQPKDAQGNQDFSKVGPFSKTVVINDLTGSSTQPRQNQRSPFAQTSKKLLALLLGAMGTLGAVINFVLLLQKKKK